MCVACLSRAFEHLVSCVLQNRLKNRRGFGGGINAGDWRRNRRMNQHKNRHMNAEALSRRDWACTGRSAVRVGSLGRDGLTVGLEACTCKVRTSKHCTQEPRVGAQSSIKTKSHKVVEQIGAELVHGLYGQLLHCCMLSPHLGGGHCHDPRAGMADGK